MNLKKNIAMFEAVLIPLLRKALWIALIGFLGSFALALIGVTSGSVLVFKSAFVLGIGSLLLLCFTTTYQRYVKCLSCHQPFFGVLTKLLPWRRRCAYCDREI